MIVVACTTFVLSYSREYIEFIPFQAGSFDITIQFIHMYISRLIGKTYNAWPSERQDLNFNINNAQLFSFGVNSKIPLTLEFNPKFEKST